MEDLFSFVPAVLYNSIYISVIFGLCLIIAVNYSFSTTNEKLTAHLPLPQIGAFVFTALVILFVGFRPISSVFVDMPMYTHVYNNIYDGTMENVNDTRGEWLFYAYGNMCKRLGLSDIMYIFSLAVIYFGLMLVACWRLMRNNLFVAILFCLASFSCFAYGVNGMRNGMACSIVMVGVSLLSEKWWEKVFAFALMFCAFSIHRSTALPCICAISALLFVKDTKWAIYFWITSIFISLVAGNYVTELFVNLGFDERMDQYANLDQSETIITTDQLSGFRIDFIIYSIMPIIMAWYVTIKRNFKDKTYNIIAITYILSNAFWIMVIRSEQSNRFAYLSWFIYPIVIAYPLLRMNIWEDQDRKTALILLAYAGFTFFMTFVYYG